MAWKQLEPTGPHLSYLLISFFLLTYALFSLFIRNRLHLSEPPLATLFGIIFGPKGIGALDPVRWGLGDTELQELTRVVLGLECFAVGIGLPKYYFVRHWKSVAMLLGPVMAFGWLVSAAFIHWILNVGFPTSLVIAACLTPTDPVLAASVLNNSKFSSRVPKRIRDLLAAESGCNDGVSFPFLYFGLAILLRSTALGTFKKWLLITIFWQCLLGIILGFTIGHFANKLLRFADAKETISRASYLVFYILLALFCVGLASILGLDDFLLSFSAGIGFSRDGWFAANMAETKLPEIIDLLVNSSMFIYFGALIPWEQFHGFYELTVPKLFGLLVLILLFRRLPATLLLYRITPDLHTFREALFAGHFGPMGVGALFLAIEARAQLETDTSEPLERPPPQLDPTKRHVVDIIWPVICFVVLGSTMVHGLSTLAISVGSHFRRKEGERAPLIGAEREGFHGMEHDAGGGDSASESE
ncbi:Na(+)/H(+) antiporter 2 [Patellaria atrata CBS 101060]|uniref:Na(+)/H(+) antiporter 2 n=1 Tax=Patellaria atrata CBS 101060 TaxID=1346257 RepID=A0A9P4VS81_9PEZI|nr:Na(+)/H(+) antiporter 2 [Patellaria atrata CBS 101060]